MVFLQVFGALIALAGLFLFAREQIREKAGEHSTMQAWKVNLSGPPSLILVVIGVVLFVFPFTPWWQDNAAPPTTTTTTTTSTTTTTIEETGPPTTPLLVDIYYDEGCDSDFIEWSDDFTADGWVVSIEVFKNGIYQYDWDLDLATSTYGNYPGVCASDFLDVGGNLTYNLFVWPYNEVGWASNALYVEYWP